MTRHFLSVLLFCFVGGGFLSAQCSFPDELVNKLEGRYLADEFIPAGGNPALVEQWSDLSGNDNHFISAVNLSNKPSYTPDVLNGKGALVLDGNDQMSMGNLIDLGAAYILYSWDGDVPFNDFKGLLTRPGGPGDFRLFLGQNGTSAWWPGGFFSTDYMTNNLPEMDISNINGFNATYAYRSDPEPMNQLLFGRDFSSGDRFWNGKVLEMLLFNEALSPEESEYLRQYIICNYTPLPQFEQLVETSDFCPVELDFDREYFKSYQWNTGDTVSAIQVEQSGFYSLEVITVFNDTLNAEIEVVFPGLNIDSFTLCTGLDSLWITGLDSFDMEWQDGTQSTDYLIAEQGEYWYTVTDLLGCSFTSDTVLVQEDFFSEELVIEYDENFCSGNALSLNVDPTDILFYIWSTGSQSASIVPESDGDYWVQAQNLNNCIASDTISVEFSGIAPITEFSLSQFCEQTALLFVNESTTLDGSEIIAAEWMVNGDLLEGDEVTVTFPEYGNYLVELNVLTSLNCTGQFRDTVTIHPVPQIDFNYGLPCSGQPVIFEDSSSIALGALASWLWDFGEGNTANTPNTLFSFPSPGVGEVSLTVISDEGCAAVLETQIPVNPTPQASFDWQLTCQGSQMPFQSTTDTSLTGPLHYAWSFAGVIGEGANPQHEFSGPGDYLVTHEVWTTINNLPGCFGQQSQMVTVSPHPVLDFEHTIACAGDPFTITDVTAIGQGDSIVGRQWLVDGEVIHDSAEFSYTFPEPGDYDVVLIVQTEAGCSGQLTQTIPVGSTEAPGFTVSPEVAAPPAPVQFVNAGSYGAHHFWDFGDGNSSLEIDPIHTYQDTGIYYPQLTVIDEAGCPGIAEGEFYAFEPYFDVSIEAVNCTNENGQISVSGVLGNYNNHRLTSAELRMWLGNGTEVSEFWEGSVERNQLTSFAFSSRLNYREDIHADYLCVEILSPNGNNPDVEPTNNILCKSISTSLFAMFPPFPNPADQEIQQLFHLGQSGEVHLRLVQTDGKVIEERHVKRASGLHTERFQTGSLATGVYVLWAEFRGETAFHRIQIIR